MIRARLLKVTAKLKKVTSMSYHPLITTTSNPSSLQDVHGGQYQSKKDDNSL